ncbi:hypothetical protein ERO13_D05G299050v2 [Gossypium hirsutum]|uniref:Uncharacterized protein n=1 Tax=Gossypium barbadense TaxID=3634 RepID=A0A5J5RK46_GOSBA|nr:hypothetical protein ES319_D05G316800v1 [Gossypium barbadense]KAG4148662.1 hypothetical protein ERO13_D05G299050v2 [Gossypium hirsutum]
MEDEIPPLSAKEQLKSKWDDEDIDDSDIKESWEDEDELAPPSACGISRFMFLMWGFGMMQRPIGLKAMGSMESDSD